MRNKKHQPLKTITKISKQIGQKFLLKTKKIIIWLLRTIFNSKSRRNSANAGFVLPTVAMVSLVVLLMTTAIMLRSFDNAKSASNVRVSKSVLNAAAPAIDRAKAKLNKLFQDPRLPRSTPNDSVLKTTLVENIDEYTFGDEAKLKLTSGGDSLKTAWRFPVDTDNNGKFDSYTLYGIYFESPPITDGVSETARTPLEARTPPMRFSTSTGGCVAEGSSSLVGTNGWFKLSGDTNLKKSFFVYTVNVPITASPDDTDNYETYNGNKAVSALEYQQDRVQIPLRNNAVVYGDDLELTPGPRFRLNGRIITNSNFLTGGSHTANVELYQVSSRFSCFYNEDNAKIFVGGNLVSGRFNGASTADTEVDLFNPSGEPASAMVGSNNSIDTTTTSELVAYNNLAYVERINLLVSAQEANASTSDPKEVKEGIVREKARLGLSSYTTDEETAIRRKQLEIYFTKRTRHVPYAEVAFGGSSVGTYTAADVLQGDGDSLRPPDAWIHPFDPDDGKTATNFGVLELNISDDNLKPEANLPTREDEDNNDQEEKIGDRILVGNNLPQLWWDGTRERFVGEYEETQEIEDILWDDSDDETRTRKSRVQTLADVGTIDRDGEWETAAAKAPGSEELVGGLRVVTGAGIYLPVNTDLTAALAATNQIWSDMMPVPIASMTINSITKAVTSTKDTSIYIPDSNKTPYLRMRATAVYHYKNSTSAPIACVSSYYDPTNETTAKNLTGLPYNADTSGNSHNGIVYTPPTSAESDYEALLEYQAQLKYPNGRWVNETLQKALPKDANNRTFSEKSAIDAALCAIQILDGTIGEPDDTIIPHGAIYETTFLDARQVKTVHTSTEYASTTIEYDLPKENRQPLEIRATVLDINQLRQKQFGGATPSQEYLIPNSGIIYATRDDALPDLSAAATIDSPTAAEKSLSPVDFKLDPTRRPNAIMLINGSSIRRVNTFREAEKGLILASNIPVYIKGNFNVHTHEEFTQALESDWSNFYTRSTPNPNFACRPGDARLPNCTTGDNWRPATMLSDAITLLSNNFAFGYRNQGDYDLNNNSDDSTAPAKYKEQLGFATYNGVVTNNANLINSAWFVNAAYPQKFNSSYLNNFVTPIQRRRSNPEYLMEICLKLPASECKPDDWVVTVDNEKASALIGQSFTESEVSIVDNVTINNTTTLTTTDDRFANVISTHYVYGTGIPSGTTVTAKANNNSITISQSATMSGTVKLYFGKPPKIGSVESISGTVAPGYDLNTGEWTAAFTSNKQYLRYPRRVAFKRQNIAALTVPNSVTTNGNTTVTTTSDGFDAVNVGDEVSGTGIPSGTTVTSKTDANNIILSSPATVSDTAATLIFDNSGNKNQLVIVDAKPVILGIKDDGKIAEFPISTFASGNKPRDTTKSLQFWTTTVGSPGNWNSPPVMSIPTDLTQQPVLQPFLQVQSAGSYDFPPDTGNVGTQSIYMVGTGNNTLQNWLQLATSTEFNLVAASGDTPGRSTEDNGGLHNFVRFLEGWADDTTTKTAKISGSLIQIKRSSYATAPFQTIGLATAANSGYAKNSLVYPAIDNEQKSPFYFPPSRAWGYDVGLLSQAPDLFSQKLVTGSPDAPDEYFREVGRDDRWVKTLLCAKATTAVDPEDDDYAANAIDSDQRPSGC